MPLSASVLSDLIEANLASFGADGINLSKFCIAVATGIVNSIVGKTFTTLDSGLTPATGVGAGTGITGLSSSIMETTALGLMSSKGYNAPNLMNAIMQAVVAHLSSSATLISNDSPVYSGNGMIVLGSIAVTASEMSNNIDIQLQSEGAIGVNRTQLATVIGTGIVNNILSSGTGNLVITVSGSPPSTPVPGTGSGTGTIS